ncbi:MAG: GIY-YIG nuclease family protein [Ignavibacterium sp.]
MTISSYPSTPGVYLFYNREGLLLYVGKSKNLRSRIRAHFGSRRERKMIRRVKRIEIRETAGELGALLLESRLIKELRPLYNVASRRGRRLILALRTGTPGGYAGVRLEAVDRIDPGVTSSILGIFKHTTQAKEYLASIARAYRLCPKLLRLEQSRSACFAWHLGRCNGACVGQEEPSAYNVRLEAAFGERRVLAWPYEGPVVIEEQCEENGLREKFVIDNWCLVGNASSSGEPHRFDYDSYRILLGYMTTPHVTQE